MNVSTVYVQSFLIKERALPYKHYTQYRHSVALLPVHFCPATLSVRIRSDDEIEQKGFVNEIYKTYIQKQK